MNMDMTWIDHVYEKLEEFDKHVEHLIQEFETQVFENGSDALNCHANNQQVHTNVGDDDHHHGGDDRHDSEETSDDDLSFEENLHVSIEQKDSSRLEELLHMDFNPKDVTWMKNIYQKFEELGKGVEHIIQEVGIQVQENGKRVYSDIQELLPSLNDSTKQEPVTEEISIINSLKPNESYALNCHADNQQVHANVSDDSRETSFGLSEDNLHVSKEQNGMEFSIHELNLPLSKGETLVGDLEQDSCSTVEGNDVAPQVFDDLSHSAIEQQLDVDAFINSEMYYSCDSDPWGIMSDISDESVSVDMNSQSSSEEGEVINQELSSSAESSDSSVVFQQGLVSCGTRQSVESNEGETFEAEYLAPLNNSSEFKHGEINSALKYTGIPLSPDTDADLNTSTESEMEDIYLTDDEFEQTWELIDEEVHSIPHQQQGGSTTKRILDFFGTWFKDADKANDQAA